jgi:solute carrier family 35 protein E1
MVSLLGSKVLNKRLLNILPAPLIVGALQLGVGAIYVLIIWAAKLRPFPVLTDRGRKATRQVGFWHATGQLFTMLSLGAGPVSFTHIVKALEPFFSAIVSALCFGTWMPASVYATLLPVVGGVGYACLKERSFSWLAFTMAMASNLSFALRAVLSKVAMSSAGIGTNLTPPNVFGLVTLSSFLLSIPMALLGEGRQFPKLWNSALEQQPNTFLLIRAILLSGFFHYINNEVMFFALGQVHPITLAVGNTMKRVFIMVASVIAFGNHISLQAGIGSAVGLSGVLLYSIATQNYEKSIAARNAANKNNTKRT